MFWKLNRSNLLERLTNWPPFTAFTVFRFWLNTGSDFCRWPRARSCDFTCTAKFILWNLGTFRSLSDSVFEGTLSLYSGMYYNNYSPHGSSRVVGIHVISTNLAPPYWRSTWTPVKRQFRHRIISKVNYAVVLELSPLVLFWIEKMLFFFGILLKRKVIFWFPVTRIDFYFLNPWRRLVKLAESRRF